MKLGVVLSMFPEAHETFILRELVELQRQGVALEIFSLQRPRDPVTRDDARRLMESTHYASLLGPATIAAFLRACVRHPLRIAATVGTICRRCITRPADLCKALAILPIAFRFYEKGRQSGITHWHGHWRTVPTTACWILHRVEGVSWSAAIHGENIFAPNPLLREKLATARFIVCCTRFGWQHLRTAMALPRPADIHLNYHGLEPTVWEAAKDEAEPDAPADPPTILTAGRLVGYKGHDDLLRAVRQLHDANMPCRLRVIGEGPDRAMLKRLAGELGISESVTWLGLVPHETVLAEMRRATVFALACRVAPDGDRDGIPNVLAEAMALGTPVASTRVSGIPELVTDGTSGLLVDERRPDQLAAALQRLLRDADLRASITGAARTRVRDLFDLKRNVSELVALLRRYAGEAGS